MACSSMAKFLENIVLSMLSNARASGFEFVLFFCKRRLYRAL